MSDAADVRAAIASGGAPMVPGRWYTTFTHGGLSTGLMAGVNSRALAVPFLVSRACVLTGMGIDITIASEAGGLVRHGIYADSGGMPGAKIIDAGTVDATVLGFNPVTFAQAVQPDWYWLVTSAQVVATTRPTVRVFQQGGWNRIGDTTGGSATAKAGYYMDGITGAFPDNFITAGFAVASAVPAVWLKA